MRRVRDAVTAWVRRRGWPRRRTVPGERPGERPLVGALQRALLAGGAACLLWWTAGAVRAAVAVDRAGGRLARMAGASTAAAPKLGDPLGTIAIPRLKLKAIVVEGDGDLELSYAAGHLPGTALPGAGGNAALAGHRDGVFAGLGRVRAGDSIIVTTPAARYRYVVSSTRVVGPGSTWVLDPTPRASLTLVTCYPFRYVGSAPQRYVVHARLAGATPVPPAHQASGSGRRTG